MCILLGKHSSQSSYFASIIYTRRIFHCHFVIHSDTKSIFDLVPLLISLHSQCITKMCVFRIRSCSFVVTKLCYGCCGCLERCLLWRFPLWTHKALKNAILIGWYGPLARYVKLRAAHAPGMPETFSPPPGISDTDNHHDTCVTHVPWCIPGSLTIAFRWSRWRGERSRHFRRMRNT